MAARFDAFISYSRRGSATLAVDLQSAVERFAKPWYRLRAVRVFRDDSSMSANVALWSTIEDGLKQAEWFVLLASPLAAASEYVAKEVTWWREHKSADRILIVLEEGVDIAWDHAANDFDWERTDSLPRALSGAYAEEPRWIDLRWYELDDSRRKTDPRWLERVADVAAAVRFAERDQLIGENVHEHRKAQRLLRAGIATLSVLLVLAVVAAFLAVGQRNEAQRQTRVAVEQRREAETQARIALARQLASQAVALAPTDIRTASLLAVQAFRTNADAQTRAALFQLATASPQLVGTLPLDAEVSSAAVTPQGVVVTGEVDGTVTLWEDGRPTTIAELDGDASSVAVSDDASVVAAADSTAVTLWRSGTTTTLTDVTSPGFVQVSADGTRLAAAISLGVPEPAETGVWRLTPTGQDFLGAVEASGSEFAFGPAGLTVYGTTGTWFVVDPDRPRILQEGFHFSQGPGVAVSPDGSAFSALSGSVDQPVWRDQAAFDTDADANAVAHVDFVDGFGIALSPGGKLLAVQADGVLEVGLVQDPRSAARRPFDLAGPGSTTAAQGEALSFGGDRYLVSASGDDALLWDLRQQSRFGTEVAADVPVVTGFAGIPQQVSVSPDGTRVLMNLTGGGAEVVTDLATGEGVALDPEYVLQLQGVSWVDDGHVVGWSADRRQLVVIDASTAAATDAAPFEVGEEDSVLATRSDGSVDGKVSVILRSGELRTVDLATGEAIDSATALVGSFDETEDVATVDIAPDQSSASVQSYGFNDLGLLAKVRRVDVDSDAMDFETEAGQAAIYDRDSRLHVFDGETVGVVDENGDLGDQTPAQVTFEPPLAMDPAGALAVSGGTEGVVSLLDLTRQGAVFGTMAVPQEEDRFAVSAFSPDSSLLVTSIQPMPTQNLETGLLRTLSLDPDDWIVAACAVAARDLTEEDWDRYGVGPAPDDLRCVQ